MRIAAAPAEPYEFVSQAGAAPVGMTADGSNVYLALGSVLTTWTVDPSGGLRPVGRSSVQPEVLHQLVAEGPAVYALGPYQRGSGTHLYRFDVSDRAQPRLSARLAPQVDLPYGELALAEPALWLLEGADLRRIDGRTPESPRPAGRLSGALYNRLAADGAMAAALSSAGELAIVDGRDPDAPVLRGRFRGGLDALSRPLLARVALADRHAFLAGGSPPTSAPTLTPERRSTQCISCPPTVAPATRTPFGRLPATPAPYFRVLDVGTPGQPREVAALRDGATVAEWMGFQDGLAFLSTGSRDELRVVDARTPTAPRLRGRLQAAIDGPPLPAGEHVLLRRGNAVEVVALHDLDKPVSLGERNLAAGVPWQVNAMALQGQTLAVADYGRGIHLLGLQDGVLGPELALVPNPGVLGVAFMDAGTGRAYLLWLDGDGLTVADTSDPRAPNVVGRLFFPVNTGTNVTFGRGIAVAGGYAWVANGSRGLVVVDLADPTLPRLSGQPIFPGEPQPDYAYGVAISGTTAFAFGSKPRLYPFDIRDPARPHEFPWVELPQPPSAVLAHDGYAYVAARIAGEASLAVVDVRAPNVPKVMGELRLPWSTDLVQFVAPPGLMVSDRLVYLVGQSLLPVDVTDPNRLLPLSPIVVPHLPRSLVIHPPPPAIASGNMLVFADDGDAGVTVMRRRGVGIATASPSPTIPGTPGTTAVPTRTPPPIATATEPPTATAPAGRLWLPQLWNEPVRQRWPVLAEATRAGVIGMTTGPVSVTTNAALPLANRQLRSRHLTGGR